MAPIILAIGPRRATVASTSFSSKGIPNSSQISSMKVRTVGVSWSGNSCSPSLATAAANSVTALSLLVIDPWPAVPRAVSFIHAMPFSAVSTRYRRRFSLTVNEKPPTSLMAESQSANSSGCSFTRYWAPQVPPASSSARKASTMSRGGRRPSRSR